MADTSALSGSGALVSEREAVRRERKAWVAGRRVAHCDGACSTQNPCTLCAAAAARLYPLPLITRPRVVRDPRVSADYGFRCVNDVLQERPLAINASDTWVMATGWPWNSVTVRVFGDLLANPTEQVEDDSR